MAPSNRRRVHVLPPNAHLSPRARTFNTRTHAHACMHERMHTLRNHQFSRNSWQIHFEETKDFENQEKIRQSVTKSTLFSLGYWESNNIINNQISLCTSSPPPLRSLGDLVGYQRSCCKTIGTIRKPSCLHRKLCLWVHADCSANSTSACVVQKSTFFVLSHWKKKLESADKQSFLPKSFSRT